MRSAMRLQAGVLAWNAAQMRVDAALQAGLDRAIGAVTAWRDVPASVVDAAKQTRSAGLCDTGR